MSLSTPENSPCTSSRLIRTVWSPGGAHHLRQVQRQDRVVGAERLATQKLGAPGRFVACLFDEGDPVSLGGAVDDAQQQVQFREPDG